MQFRVLGPVDVAAGPSRLALRSARQRTLLAVLLATAEELSAERLIEALWGTRPPPSARTTLRSHLSQLRRHLDGLEAGGGSAIVTAVGGYHLDLGAHELDAARFEEAARQAGHAVSRDPLRAEQLLDDALTAWSGPAFGELADHELVHPEAVRLEMLRAAAITDRIDARLALGRHREVVAELDVAVLADPLDERAHGQLMLALYRSGRQADALAVYETLRGRLRDELGVDPSPELRRLHEQILRQEVGPVAAAWGPEHPARGPHERQSPPPRRPSRPGPGPTVDLIGRDEELAAVIDLVTTYPLVTLTGPGGVGKTRLAEQVGFEVAETLEDGVVTCGLAVVRDAAGVAPALMGALGIEHPDLSDPEAALALALGERRLLLLLDNCEHLLPTVAQLVDALLRRCPRLAVLATSREPLHLPGERVWQLAPLAAPRPGSSPSEILQTPAGALFVVRAEAAESTFALTDESAGPVAELCRRLDGLPLAIELAAARVRALTPADLVARLDQRFALLAARPGGETGRHRTLQAVVGWSYELLDEPQARLFNRLSVFAGAFPLHAAERVGGVAPLAPADVAGLLADLVDRSMVVVERTGGAVRYRQLETLREFGARRLDATGDAAGCRRAHASHHLALVEELGPQVGGAREHAAVAGIEAAIDDLRLAHDWLLGEPDVEGALRLPAALHEYLLFRPRAEMFDWAERALRLPDAASHPAYPAAMATAAYGAVSRGEVNRGRRLAEEALERAAGRAALRSLGTLSVVALYEGRIDEVLALSDRIAALTESLDEPFYRALSRLDPALALHYRGQRRAAAACMTELNEAAEAADNPTARAWASYVRGETTLETDPAGARRHLAAAVDAAREAGSRKPEGVALVSLASLCGRTGEPEDALRRFGEAIRLWRRLGDHTHQVTTVRNLVEFLVRVGADERAALLLAAVDSAAPPSFGAEADRLAEARRTLKHRLGAEQAGTAAERGRRLAPGQLAAEALATVEALLSA